MSVNKVEWSEWLDYDNDDNNTYSNIFAFNLKWTFEKIKIFNLIKIILK